MTNLTTGYLPVSQPKRDRSVNTLVVADCCESSLCPHHLRRQGPLLAKSLLKAFAPCPTVLRLDLNANPALFETPLEAFDYLHGKRCVARLVRELGRLELLHSPRYFSVTEFHKSGWPHHHVLLDAAFIPWQQVQRIWTGLLPAGEGKVSSICVSTYRYTWPPGPVPCSGWPHEPGLAGEPGYDWRCFGDDQLLGHIQYVLKKWLSQSDLPFPDWVYEVDIERKFHLFSHSKHLFPASRAGRTSSAARRKPATRQVDQLPPPLTRRELLERCNQSCAVFEKSEGLRFIKRVNKPAQIVRQELADQAALQEAAKQAAFQAALEESQGVC